ncbi:hypothetical protein PG985_007532 [Apiospora marii]|uniref:uncharacterized protein n=1 Tax=Apiospora marii TaxID=335849 RepID=UPI0031307F33
MGAYAAAAAVSKYAPTPAAAAAEEPEAAAAPFSGSASAQQLSLRSPSEGSEYMASSVASMIEKDLSSIIVNR